MPRALPPARIVRQFIDEDLGRQAPVWALCWDEAPGEGDRLWELPEGLSVVGPPPRVFGVAVKPRGAGGYAVRVRWDRTLLTWADLPRAELLGSCLGPLLAGVGCDLWALLDRPLSAGGGRPRAA